tara:strand:- start:270 stop:755 length:486 start_codon:yes stop_codon:yes gene_type:complete
MIITCPNCNKKFKIDNSLIPYEGRDLQCGSCDYLWFYKNNDDDEQILEPNKEILIKETETEAIKKEENKIEEIEKVNTYTKELKKKQNIKSKFKETKHEEESKESKFFSYFIVLIISFIALIVVLDTFKTPLTNIIPGLDIILLNLFETLKDIKLFIIDLI